MRYFEEAKGGVAVLLDSTQDICHFYYGTSETSALLILFMQHIQNMSIYWYLLKGRLYDAEQFSDTQRIISETAHGPQASNSLLVLAVFREFQIKSKRAPPLII